MTSPTIRTRFSVGSAAEPWEEELSAWCQAHPAERPDLLDLEGSIFVTGDGQQAQVADQMISVIPSLCFDAVVEVLDKGESVFNLYTAQTTVRLRAQDGMVDLGSTVCDLVAFPRAAFLEALVACGERFIRLAETLWGDDPDNADIFTSLKSSAAAARGRLG